MKHARYTESLIHESGHAVIQAVGGGEVLAVFASATQAFTRFGEDGRELADLAGWQRRLVATLAGYAAARHLSVAAGGYPDPASASKDDEIAMRAALHIARQTGETPYVVRGRAFLRAEDQVARHAQEILAFARELHAAGGHLAGDQLATALDRAIGRGRRGWRGQVGPTFANTRAGRARLQAHLAKAPSASWRERIWALRAGAPLRIGVRG